MKENRRELDTEELEKVTAGGNHMVGGDELYGKNVSKKPMAMAYGIGIDIVWLLPDDPDMSDEEYMDKAKILETAVKAYMDNGMTREQAIQTARSTFNL